MINLNSTPSPLSLTVTLIDKRNNKTTLTYDLTTDNVIQALVDSEEIVKSLNALTTAKIQKYSLDVEYWNKTRETAPKTSGVYKSAQIEVDIAPYEKKGGKYTSYTLSIPSPVPDLFTDQTGQMLDITHDELNNYISLYKGDIPKVIVRSRKYKVEGIKGGYWKSKKAR